jgi:proline iminopeptidase
MVMLSAADLRAQPSRPAIDAQLATPSVVQLRATDGFLAVPDGVRLHYRVIGAGRDTVFVVHGGPGFGSDYLIPDLLPLAAHHTLVFVDQRNAGRSTLLTDTAALNAARLVDDLEAVRRYFRGDQLTLLGHSWGGLLSGLYATRYPTRVKRMLLLAAVAPVASAMNGFAPMARIDSSPNADRVRNLARFRAGTPDSTKACWDYYAIWVRGYFATPVGARRMWGDMCLVPVEAMLRGNSGYPSQSLGPWDLRANLKAVTAPVLILHGDADPVPLTAAQAWQAALPNARLFILPGAAHMPHVDRPAAAFAAMEQFFAGGWPDTSVLTLRAAAVVLPSDRSATPYLRLRGMAATVEDALVSAVGRAAWDSVSRIYAEDAVIFAPASPPIVGRKAIAAFWRTLAGRGMRELELQVMDLTASGGQLDVVGKYVMYGADGSPLDVGKFLAQYRRDAQGRWRLSRDVLNSSMETRSPLEVPDYLTRPPVRE